MDKSCVSAATANENTKKTARQTDRHAHHICHVATARTCVCGEWRGFGGL